MSRANARAAQRAGLRFIATLTGASARDEFAAHAVEGFLESLAALPAALASLSRAS